MKYFNFSVQTLAIGAGSVFAIWFFIDPAMEPYFYITELFLGLWQYGGCLLLGQFTKGNRAKKYAQLAGLYILLLAGSSFFFELFAGDWIVRLYTLFIIIPPWLLAFYYYHLTISSTFVSKNYRRGFLPNLGF